jgi:hypothetical protein
VAGVTVLHPCQTPVELFAEERPATAHPAHRYRVVHDGDRAMRDGLIARLVEDDNRRLVGRTARYRLVSVGGIERGDLNQERTVRVRANTSPRDLPVAPVDLGRVLELRRQWVIHME